MLQPMCDDAQTVRAFLKALQAGDLDAATAMLTDDAEWINVSLPTIRGRVAIERVLRFCFVRLRGSFRVEFHNIAARDGIVLTERTDEIAFGPLEHRFWVYGRFELRDGKIAVWRDSFDWGDALVGLARGLAAIVVPSLNRRWPDEPQVSSVVPVAMSQSDHAA